MTLSVLVVSPVAEAGGAETLMLDVLEGLQRKGVKVALVALGSGPLPEVARARGLTVHTGPALSFRRPWKVVCGVVAVRRAVAAARPDVLLGSHPKGQLVGRLATTGYRSVAHVTQLYDPPGWAVTTRVAAHLRGPRLSITDETAEAYRALNQRLRPIVVPPGTNAGRLLRDASLGDPDLAWAHAGLEGPGPRIVMTGRLQRFKGPFDCLAAAELVVQARPDARFLIVGPDSPIEPGLRKELDAAIRSRNLKGSVGLAGRLSSEDLAATVAGATLLVHPARREPFGLAIVEALTLGTPVVAFATTGPSTILHTGGGAVVPVGNVEGLARAALRALEDPAILTQWEAEAGTTARRFQLDAVVERYLAVLNDASPRQDRDGRRVTTIGVGPPGASGVRDYAELLDAELARRNLAVNSCWLDNAGDRLAPAVRVSLQLARIGLRVPRNSAIIWHYSPVVHGLRGLPGPGVLVGTLLLARGCRVVTVLHELRYTYRPGVDHPQAWVKAKAQSLALRAVLAGSTAVVVTTDRRADDLAPLLRGSDKTVRVLPVFPTIPVLRRSASPVDPPDGRFVIGVPAFAGDGVRADVLVGALRLLGDPEVRVVLLGAPGADSEGGREWLRLAVEHGVHGCLEFTGVVGASELSRRLSESTVVVLLNEEGPSSRKTSLAAALAHGLPVVSLDGYNRWDAVIDAGAVCVVSADASVVAATLSRLRNSAADREALAVRAADFADRHLSLSQAGNVFVELLGARSVQTACTDGCASRSSTTASTVGLSNQPRSSHGSGATA